MTNYQLHKLLLHYQSMPPEDRAQQLGYNDPDAGRVYFVAGGGLVRIGYTSNVETRSEAIEALSPVALELLSSHCGTRKLRNLLQQLFEYLGYRKHGDWFAANELLSELAAADDLAAATETLITERLTVEVGVR